MGAQDYLDQAIGWARQTGLQVVIDLHGKTSLLRDAKNCADPSPFYRCTTLTKRL